MALIRVNGHDLYYEIHGSGDPVLCMGGWGTYCHGGERNLARGLTDRYSVAIFDYRGIGESEDTPGVPATTRMHADDAIALLDHLGWSKVHLIGLVGIGACVCQEIAIARPDLARSMVNMGSWAFVDDYLRDQLEMFRVMHRDSGFYAFQKLVCVLSFLPDYYNAHHSRLLGPDGGWKELNGRFETHSRLIDACLSHDVRGRLAGVGCPSFVIHAARDMVTSPRYTRAIEAGIPGAEGYLWQEVAHVVAGKEQKIRFCELLFDFLDRVEIPVPDA
jgi:pimeloyl-ACP methyl ester carboxylesterase